VPWTAEQNELLARRADGETLYRGFHSPKPRKGDLRSNLQRGKPPIRVEVSNAMIHMGVSMWASLETAKRLSRKFPNVGEHVFEVRLRSDLGIWLAETSSPGHFTVWGRPADLLRCVVLPEGSR
jgi:hypothetical protein